MSVWIIWLKRLWLYCVVALLAGTDPYRFLQRDNEFLAVADSDNRTIFGFYSLSPASVAYARTPEVLRHGLARYDVPAFRLARLAVDRRVQGQRLGGQLLLAAGRRCLLASAEVGGVALLIDAKDELVAGWYASYGAVPLLDTPLSLLLPLTTVDAALKATRKTE